MKGAHTLYRGNETVSTIYTVCACGETAFLQYDHNCV